MFVWSELKDGLTFSSNGAFCTFFFFFFFLISAWIGRFGGFGQYGRFRPIHARIGPIPRESARFGAASALKKWKPRGMTRRDAAGCVGSGVPHASPHPTASDAGAAPLVPRPCFTKFLCIFGRRKKKRL